MLTDNLTLVIRLAIRAFDVLKKARYYHGFLEIALDLLKRCPCNQDISCKRVELLLDCYLTHSKPHWNNLQSLLDLLLEYLRNEKQLSNSSETNTSSWFLKISQEFSQPEYFIGQTVLHATAVTGGEILYPIKIIGISWDIQKQSWEYDAELPLDHPDFDPKVRIWSFQNWELKAI
ncbi:MAG TPA: hypothetical protein VK184_10905 [Nostocaceae cyanobacterium]|nr:hypothetical protein [Nostocaceae cyanobacterium]